MTSFTMQVLLIRTSYHKLILNQIFGDIYLVTCKYLVFKSLFCLVEVALPVCLLTSFPQRTHIKERHCQTQSHRFSDMAHSCHPPIDRHLFIVLCGDLL